MAAIPAIHHVEAVAAIPATLRAEVEAASFLVAEVVALLIQVRHPQAQPPQPFRPIPAMRRHGNPSYLAPLILHN